MEQKICCNVSDCTHNATQDCTCKLNKIEVNPCNGKHTRQPQDETSCSMYSYCGDLNERENYTTNQL